jgi:hypothetical protein
MKVVHRDDLPAVKGEYCARRESISGNAPSGARRGWYLLVLAELEGLPQDK